MYFTKISGLIAAPFAPLDSSGKLNLDVIPQYYNMLKNNGIAGAFINGSTGEGVSLSDDEKYRVAAAWAGATSDDADFKVINLVGGTSIAQSQQQAAYTQQLGLYGTAFTAPYYFKPSTADALAFCCSEIASAAPDTAFYYYHIPVLTGCPISMYDLLNAVNGKIPNLAGIKYTHEDFMDYLSCMYMQNGQYDMLWGRDENMLSALVLGCKGAVGSTYNYAAPLYHELIRAFENNDLTRAKDLQYKSIEIIRLLGKYGGIATGKAYMKLIGLDCGGFRLPVQNMNPSLFEAFKTDVSSLGFEKYCSKL